MPDHVNSSSSTFPLSDRQCEAFCEPAEDKGEQGHRVFAPAPPAAQAGEACRAAQFPGLCVLPARYVHGLLHGRLGVARRPSTEQGLAPEPMELGFKRRRSSRLFDRLQPSGGRRERRFGLAARQLRIGLEGQQYMLVYPKT